MIKTMSQEFHPIDFRRQVALENRLAQYELYFQFDWEKRKPNSLAYFFSIMTHQIQFIVCKAQRTLV